MARKKKDEVVIEVEQPIAPVKQEQVPIVPKVEAATAKPNPVEKFDGYSVEWFKTEKDASAFHRTVRERGDVYGSGKLAGMSCGRDESLDRDGMFAVTFNKA
jgi:hypothetical protein